MFGQVAGCVAGADRQDPQLHHGEFGVELAQRRGDQRQRQEAFDDQHQLGLDALGDALRLHAELGHVLHDPPDARQQRAALFGQDGAIAAAVEQDHPALILQLLDGIGDRGLRPPQPAGGGGEAALVQDGQEDGELIEGDGIHVVQFIRRTSSKLSRFFCSATCLSCSHHSNKDRIR